MSKKRDTKLDNDATSTDHFHCPRCAYMDKKAVEVFYHIRSEHGVEDTFLICSDPCFETGHFMKGLSIQSQDGEGNKNSHTLQSSAVAMSNAQEKSTFHLKSQKTCEFRCSCGQRSMPHDHCPACRNYAARQAQESTETPVKTETTKPTGKKRKKKKQKKKQKVQANSSTNDDLTEESVNQQSDSRENNSVRAADETVTPNPKKSRCNKRKNQEEQPWDVEIPGILENQTMSTKENSSAKTSGEAVPPNDQPSNVGIQGSSDNQTGSTNDEAKIDGKGPFVCSCVFQAVKNALTGPLLDFLSWIDVIGTLLRTTASPNCRNEHGETPLLYSLHLAKDYSYCDPHFEKRLMQIWRLLLEAGASAKGKDEEGRSLLHLLLNFLQTGVFQPHECLELVSCGLEILQQYGFEINSRDANGNTPLHLWGSYLNKPIPAVMEIGAKIISNGGAVNARNDNGETPLHLSQSWEVVDFLVEEGAQTDAQDLHGNTPLHKFTGTFVGDKVKIKRWKRCLQDGMDPFCKNEEGKCHFEVLLDKRLFKSALNLMKAIFEEDELADFAQSASDYRDCKGNTLLHILCVIDNEDAHSICEYLLKKGWSVHLQNKCNETPLHLVSKKVGNMDAAPSQVMANAIILLREYHADVRLPDGQGKTCEEMLSGNIDLPNLLHEDIDIVNIPNKIKWIPQSNNHKAALAEVARGTNSVKVDCFHYHKNHIGGGSFSFVFPALNEKDGRELALKRLERARLEERGNVLEREVRCLLQLSDCPFVVNYISYASDCHFKYLALELMEGCLDEFLSSEQECEHALTICRHTATGLEFLHSRNIIHRNLDLSNILCRFSPNLIFKISGFGRSKMLTSSASSGQTETVMHSKAGTRCWMAPELLEKKPKKHSKASDVFSLALIFHATMAKKKHPFGSYSEDSAMNLLETEDNIRRNRSCFCPSLTREAKYLLEEMLSVRPEQRPTAADLMKFPFFWDDHRKVDFILTMGNEREFKEPRCKVNRPLTDVEESLELDYRKEGHGNWAVEIQDVYNAVISEYSDRTYTTTSAVELIRFYANADRHPRDSYQDSIKQLFDNFFVLERYPFLVTSLYKAIQKSKESLTWKIRRHLKKFF